MRIVFEGLAFGMLLVTGACGGGVLDDSLKDIKAGDCVVDPGSVTEVQRLKEAACGDPDAIEVVGTFEITGYDEFPGEAAVDFAATQQCDPSSTGYIGPTQESWDGAGDRVVICLGE